MARPRVMSQPTTEVRVWSSDDAGIAHGLVCCWLRPPPLLSLFRPRPAARRLRYERRWANDVQFDGRLRFSLWTQGLLRTLPFHSVAYPVVEVVIAAGAHPPLPPKCYRPCSGSGMLGFHHCRFSLLSSRACGPRNFMKTRVSHYMFSTV
jgi:hypothetical protein